jgi:signal transduction histidine kinase
MQAQPQSTPAARIPSQLASLPSLSSPSAAPRPPAPPAPSVADSTGLAHDAGNLLAALSLYSALLSAPGVLRTEHQHYATELRLISDRSTQLIRRLFAAPAATAPPPSSDATLLVAPKLFRRSRNGRASDFATTSPNPAAVLLSLAPVLQRIAAGAARVTVTCPTALAPLGFPSEIIERITVNLVRNAAEALRLQQSSASATTAQPGQIRVTLAAAPNRLQLTVEDNGPGMSPSNVEAYLRPTPLPPGANHGLGHRIIHDLATSSRGQLSMRVRPGQGTTFCLKWPLPSSPPAEPCSSAPPSSSPTE